MNDNSRSSESVQPIILKAEDLFVSVKLEKSKWLTNVGIYNAIGMKVHMDDIKGLQRVRIMSITYMDTMEHRLTFVT